MELRNLLRFLGFRPPRGMMEEAMRAVGVDVDGQLGAYRVTRVPDGIRPPRGILQGEVEDLRHSFQRFSEFRGHRGFLLEPENIRDALVQGGSACAAPSTRPTSRISSRTERSCRSRPWGAMPAVTGNVRTSSSRNSSSSAVWGERDSCSSFLQSLPTSETWWTMAQACRRRSQRI